MLTDRSTAYNMNCVKNQLAFYDLAEQINITFNV